MPSTDTSSSRGWKPYASAARMHALCAVSNPSMSSEGFASAYPSFCASFSTTSNGSPSFSMRVRM